MAKHISIAAIVVTCLCLLSFTVPSAEAQAVYGGIIGTVTDPQGAAVPNAKVTVTNESKANRESTTSNESGNYSVTHLIPDVYTVRVEAAGFKVSEQKGVIVNVDSNARVDLQFQVGGTSETVEVTGEAPQLKTDRADVAVTFNAKAVEELPVLNRNFQSLELLTPGTQRLTGWAHASTENPQGSQQIFVNGQHFSGTAYELDGTDNQDPILGIIIVNPNLDSITESKITTQNYDAEFGKALAGIVTTQTKSGSNEFHGSGFFFTRSNFGAARPDPFSTAPVSANSWRQYGGSLGGPLVKNKLFFFGDYQGTRRSSGITFTGTVPTQLVRDTCLTSTASTCDLSQYINLSGTGKNQIYNPTTKVAYDGNIIPRADLLAVDPGSVAASILSLLPKPNAGGDGAILNNYTASGSGAFNDYGFNTRIDYTASQKLTVFGRYSYASFKVAGTPFYDKRIGGPGTGSFGLAGQSLIHNQSLAAGFDYTLSSTLLTDFRFGLFRYNPHSTKFDQNVAAATALGLPGLNTSDNSTLGLPGFFFNGTLDQCSGVGNCGVGEDLNITRCNCPLTERETGLQFVNNWTKIFGNHQFKFGTDLRRAYNLRTPSDANRTGELHFQRATTGNAAGDGGLDLATFMFAQVTSFNRYVGSSGELTAEETQNRYFIYGQDTWRVSPKLTLNYGLRWEIYMPESVNGKGNGGFAVLPEGVIRVGGYGANALNGSTATTYKNFAPRLGVAYQFNPKTVLRMGYGRSFDIGVFGSLFGHTVTQNLPVLANQNLRGVTGDDKSAAFNFTVGPSPNQFPVIPNNGILPLRGPNGDVTPHVRPDKVRVPTVDAWNATLQRQLTNTLSLEVAFVGNKGTHVFRGYGPSYNVNNPTIVGCVSSGCNPLTGSVPRDQRRPFYNKFTTPYTDANGVTTDVKCCSGDLGYAGNDSNNSYRALQIKVDKRLTNGLQFMGHYTYSRAYGYNDDYIADPKVVYGLDSFNRNSVFILTSVWELPFGKGKHFAGNVGRAADAVIGGWQWNSTWTIGSGLPWTPSYGSCNEDIDVGPCRPNINGSFHVGTHRKNGKLMYFDPYPSMGVGGTAGPFSRPSVGTFGSVKRNSFTGPAEFLSDMSLFKNFSITERVKLQTRFEFFNIFNHPVWGFNSNQGNTCIDCGGSAGQITSLETSDSMRKLQFGLRVTF
jgi:outer membrane receptor protein involved in Fe transport